VGLLLSSDAGSSYRSIAAGRHAGRVNFGPAVRRSNILSLVCVAFVFLNTDSIFVLLSHLLRVCTEVGGGGGVVMSCVRWRTDDDVRGAGTMLVTTYGAGCRPRYRCVRVLRRSPSLLYLQLSDAASWPLVRSPRDPVDCRAFNFDRWTASPAAAAGGDGSTTDGYLLSLVADRRTPVDCRLPAAVAGVPYEAEFVVDGDRERCAGALTDSGRSLRLAVAGCGSGVRRRFADSVYRCLESSAVTRDSQDDLVIVTESDSGSSALSCWLFRGRAGRPSSFYLLVGDQCHAAVATRSSSATSFRHRSRRIVYTAFFSRPRAAPSTITLPPPRSHTTRSLGLTDPSSTAAGTSSSPRRPPRLRNVTMQDADPDQQPASFKDAFVVAVAAVVMALIQLLIFLCRC